VLLLNNDGWTWKEQSRNKRANDGLPMNPEGAPARQGGENGAEGEGSRTRSGPDALQSLQDQKESVRRVMHWRRMQRDSNRVLLLNNDVRTWQE
jgi:hypothetical protein